MKFIITDKTERNALNRAFLRYLAIPIVLILLVSFLISYYYYDTKKHDLIHKQTNEIVSAMITYRDHISHLTAIMRTVESDYLSQIASDASLTDMESMFLQYLIDYPNIDTLRVLDTSGTETLRIDQNSGLPAIVTQNNLQDQSDRCIYQETRILGLHQFLFSELSLSTKNSTIEYDSLTGVTKPILRISTPVNGLEERLGYLVVHFLMRSILDEIRNSIQMTGCYILMFNEDGYLYNDAEDANNFGCCPNKTPAENPITINSICPIVELGYTSAYFVDENKLCSYIRYSNIYNRSKDYFLSETSSEYLYFLAYYDNTSPFANDLHFAYFYHLAASWAVQLIVWLGILLVYTLMIHLFFTFDRMRFTELFSDHRYTKTELRQALRQHEFINYYQPIINIQDGSLLGIEALSRWKRGKQIIPPSMFIDEMLHYQLGQTLDENVFAIVRKDRKRMETVECFTNTFISINCCQQTFDSLIKEPPTTTIMLTEEEKRYIVLELLENIVFNQRTQDRIRELYKHNIIFAIDDFGTGNSNVAFIRSFENLKVKIDRAFVPVDTTDPKERVIIEAFVKMFIDQGLKMIVEGVETLEQIRYLRSLGVQGVQGFYFSKPMTIDQLIIFMENKSYLDKL